MKSLLHRYWVTFNSRSAELPPGIGVTAFSLDDALALIQEKVWKGRQMPEPETITADVDVSTLDAGHVLPNMDEPTSRGIWFPKGFNDSRQG